MKEFLVTPANFESAMHEISGVMFEHFEESVKLLRVQITESSGTGKWGLARLWRSWMSVTADYMAANGVTMPLMISKDGEYFGTRRFSAQDAHELFTAQWLGLNEKGERLSWQKNDGDNVADKGQRFMAMLKHENWCVEKGINLPQPRDSELEQLKQQQNQ